MIDDFETAKTVLVLRQQYLRQVHKGIIRILHVCQVWIDKCVPRVTFWHHETRRVMQNCDPRDRFVYPYLTLM